MELRQPNQMKKLILSLGVLVAISASSQTVSNSVPSFVSTAGSYFTSFNTNLLTFQAGSDNFDILTGTENWNNDRLLAFFKGDVKIYQINTSSVRGVASLYNDSSFGTISKADGGLGYAYVIFDTKVTASANFGYDWTSKAGYARPDLRFEKAMTQHTFAGINIGLPILFHNQGNITPNYGFSAGFNF